MNIQELKNIVEISKMAKNNKYFDLYISYPKYCYGLEPDITPTFIVTNIKGYILYATKSYQKAFMFVLHKSIEKGDNNQWEN